MRGVTNCTACCSSPSGFLLTRLMRGVTAEQGGQYWYTEFLLTRLMRGVTTISMQILVTT